MGDNKERESIGSVVPMIDEESKGITATAIDLALAKGLDLEGLKRLKAVEYTIQFLKNRQGGVKAVQETYETFLKQINNEPKQ